MMDEHVEGGEKGGNQERSCWTPRLSLK
jgi:hypothetical protein